VAFANALLKGGPKELATTEKSLNRIKIRQTDYISSNLNVYEVVDYVTTKYSTSELICDTGKAVIWVK